MKINLSFYRKTAEDIWTGRNDGPAIADQRWHQRIVLIDLLMQDIPKLPGGQKGIALIGFACDEGVRRNGGRIGAKEGPYHFRKASCNLPVHFNEEVYFVDLGDIICENSDLEGAQNELSLVVKTAIGNGYQPLVIGGGHEVAYAHYNGIKASLPAAGRNIGIINFDAHFDLREKNENGYHSGTGFRQIAADCASEHSPFRYLPIGIQQNSNTKQLFDCAAALNVNYISAEQFIPAAQAAVLETILQFLAGSSVVYLTICMDVFSSSAAPGVSAAAYSGIFPDPFFFHCLAVIMTSGKVISTDIAEYNPVYDTDQRTAKLAAALAFKMIPL